MCIHPHNDTIIYLNRLFHYQLRSCFQTLFDLSNDTVCLFMLRLEVLYVYYVSVSCNESWSCCSVVCLHHDASEESYSVRNRHEGIIHLVDAMSVLCIYTYVPASFRYIVRHHCCAWTLVYFVIVVLGHLCTLSLLCLDTCVLCQ